MAIASTACSSAAVELLVVLAVAEHAEVAGDAGVGLDDDAGQDLLALLEAQAFHVEVGEADAVGGVGGVLAVVRGHRLREALEVLGDLARVRHGYGEGSARVRPLSARTMRAPRANKGGTHDGDLRPSRRGAQAHERARAPVLRALERRRAEARGAELLRGRVPPRGGGARRRLPPGGREGRSGARAGAGAPRAGGGQPRRAVG